MTPHHSILQTQLPDKRLRWMLAVSLVIHLIVFGICFFKAPGDRVYFNPYANSISVDLLAAPGPPGPRTDSPPTVQQQPVKLWKGPAKVEADTKVSVERSHNVITVQKKEENVYDPTAEKRSSEKEGPQKPAAAAAQSPAGVDTNEFAEPDKLPLLQAAAGVAAVAVKAICGLRHIIPPLTARCSRHGCCRPMTSAMASSRLSWCLK